MIKRQVLAGAAAALLASIGMGGAGTTVAADGNFYAYEHANYTGGIYSWVGNSSDWSNGIDNKSSSWRNNGYNTEPDEVVLYRYPGYSTPIACIPRGMAVSIDYVINDLPSSHRWVTSCPAINR